MYYRSLGFLLALLGTLLFSFALFMWGQTVSAAVLYPLEFTGHLWTGTQNTAGGGIQGLGWISMNCADGGQSGGNVCGSSDYKVVVNNDKTVTGYAWIGGSTDPNGNDVPGGFVRFGGLTGCPSGTCDARVIGSDSGAVSPAAASGYELTGWARACAVFQSGCNGALKPSDERGSWDGWISLNCENTGGCGTSNYAARINNNGQFSSNSIGWGSDVMGRVYFSFSEFAPACTTEALCSADYTESTFTNMWCEDTVTVCDDVSSGTICNPITGQCDGTVLALSGTIEFDRLFVRKGEEVGVEWQLTSGSGDCELEGSNGDRITTNPGQTNAITTNKTTYRLMCTPTGGSTAIEIDSATLEAVASTFES